MKLQLLIVTILITLLVTCKPKEGEPSNSPDIKFTIPQPNQLPADLVVYDAATSIYGEWFNIDPENPAELTFNLDGTFHYVFKNGLKDSVHGKWTINGSNYILRSERKSNRNEKLLCKDNLPLFEKIIRFKDGVVYELNKTDSLSNYYFVQQKNYR